MKKDYSRKLLVTLLLCVASVLVSHAQEVYTVDGLKYVILDEESVELRDVADDLEGDIVIPSVVTIEDKAYTVTSIGGSAFLRSSISSLRIPASVTFINEGAFWSCEKLKVVSFNDAEEPLTVPCGTFGIFYYSPVDSIYLGRDVVETSVWGNKWGIIRGANKLRSVHIGAKVKTLDSMLFLGCTSLVNVIIEEGLETIGSKAFSGASSLTEIHLPKSLRTIEDYAFESCPSLQCVSLQEGLTTIGKGAFNIAPSLTTIHLPQSLTTLGNYAFYKSGLPQINIPSNLKYIGEETFSNSANLETVYFDEGVDSIARKAFYACACLQHMDFPNSLSYLGVSAFENCRSLTSVHAGTNLRVIAEKAFYKCASLNDLVLPDVMASIGKSAFAYCDSLRSFEFPDGLTEIHSNTLAFSHGIKKLTYGKDVVKMDALGIDGFSTKMQLDTIVVRFSRPIEYPSNYEINLIVKVPHGCGCDFRKAKKWSSHIIMEEDEEVVWAHVSEPGTLYAEINKQIQPAYVGKLKVTGQLNENDWKVLQRDKTGFLYSIDLSEVTNTTIPASQFNGKSWLTDIRLPQDLEIISYNAFYGCSRLTGRLELPESFSTFGQSSMSKTNFSEIVLNSEVTVERDAFQYCNSLKSITSDSIISLGSSVFYSCPALEKFISSEKLTIINNSTFWGCSGLKEVILSEGITKIGDYAFSGCSSLKAVLIPSSTKSIGALAFSSCISLQDVYAFGAVPCSCAGNAFQSIMQEATLHVPDGTEGDYFVARGWEKFMHIVSFDPSSVDDRTVDDQHVPAGIYDLNGRKVDSPLKGHLYIVNGQKVFIR